MNGIGHLQSVIDSWDVRSDKNINSGTVLSYDAVCVGSSVIIMSTSISAGVGELPCFPTFFPN